MSNFRQGYYFFVLFLSHKVGGLWYSKFTCKFLASDVWAYSFYITNGGCSRVSIDKSQVQLLPGGFVSNEFYTITETAPLAQPLADKSSS